MIHPIIIDICGKIRNDYPIEVQAIWKSLRINFNSIFVNPISVSQILNNKSSFDECYKV